MDVHFSQEQQLQLDQIATGTGRATNELVQEAVARSIAGDEWFKRRVQVGIDQMQCGEFVAKEEIDARVERMLPS